MTHTLTKTLTIGELTVALNDEAELEISTKRGVTVTLNDLPDLDALADIVMDARIAHDPEADYPAITGDGTGKAEHTHCLPLLRVGDDPQHELVDGSSTSLR